MTFRLDLELLEFVHRSYAKGQRMTRSCKDRMIIPSTSILLRHSMTQRSWLKIPLHVKFQVPSCNHSEKNHVWCLAQSHPVLHWKVGKTFLNATSHILETFFWWLLQSCTPSIAAISLALNPKSMKYCNCSSLMLYLAFHGEHLFWLKATLIFTLQLTRYLILHFRNAGKYSGVNISHLHTEWQNMLHSVKLKINNLFRRLASFLHLISALFPEACSWCCLW